MLISAKHVIKTATLTASVAVLSACGGSDSPTPVATAKTEVVNIEFIAMAGADRINCGQLISNLGTSNASGKLRDLRFYLSDVHLIDTNDKAVPITLNNTEWQHDGVVLIDLEDGVDICGEAGGNAAINAKVVGTVPAGTYSGVGYTLGVPLKQNHSDWSAETAPLDVQAMSWAWRGGRKFLKLEINPTLGVTPKTGTSTTAASTFNVHLGSIDCTGKTPEAAAVGLIDRCTRPNRMAFHAHAFNANTQRIAVDVRSFLANSNITEDLGGANGCMSFTGDPECVAIFEQLKIDLTTGQPIDGGHGQGLFKVVPKSGALASNRAADITPVIVVEDHSQHSASVE